MATTFPCSTFSPCFDPANPFENLSSEADDGPTFIGLDFGFGRPAPKLGSSWRVSSCLGVCESLVSQSDALLCAARNELDCANASQGTPPEFPLPNPDIPTNPPVTGDPPVFNKQVTITSYCPDGLPFTLVVAAGQFSAYSQALADQMAATFGSQEIILRKFCLSNINPLTCVDTAYVSNIIVTGGTSGGQEPFSFAVTSGALPPGITLTQISTRVAQLTGFPTTVGDYSFTVRATDAQGNFMEKNYPLTIQGFLDSSLPDFSTGSPYSFQLMSLVGSDPATYAVFLGSLPTGLTLSADGVISGTPTSATEETFILSVAGHDGFTCYKEFTLSPANCVDWSSLNWDFFVLSAITPPAVNTGSVLGDTFQFDMMGRFSNAQVFGGAHGSVLYTGDGCNCLLTINVTSMETALNSVLNFEVVIYQDGVEVLHVILTHIPFVDTNGIAVGVNVIPFSVAAGVNSVIEVDGKPFNANHEIIRCGGALGGLINGQMTFTATLSNA